MANHPCIFYLFFMVDLGSCQARKLVW